MMWLMKPFTLRTAIRFNTDELPILDKTPGGWGRHCVIHRSIYDAYTTAPVPWGAPSIFNQLQEFQGPEKVEWLLRSPLSSPYFIQQWLPEAGLALADSVTWRGLTALWETSTTITELQPSALLGTERLLFPQPRDPVLLRTDGENIWKHFRDSK